MAGQVKTILHPELIFGIAGPIGVDMDEISDSLTNALKAVRYESHIVKLTSVMNDYEVKIKDGYENNYFGLMNEKMDRANAICQKYNSSSALASIAINEITQIRANLPNLEAGTLPEKTAYIIRQLKRPDEVQLLRQVYGRQFILISAYGSMLQRRKALLARMRRDLVPPEMESEFVEKLIARDQAESDDYGQQLRETFHLADVFVDGNDRRRMDESIGRFIQAFFGRTDVSPSKDEYGMYAARSAALRSSDLSRQVGAAIFTSDGEMITQGCNEVPKAFGGTYWDLEQPDHRDVRIGYDPNEYLKREILRDLFERLKVNGLLSEKALSFGTTPQIVDLVTRKQPPKDGVGALHGASVMDLTEYGRVVHAEMCAVCDAARLGRSIRGATLYCTTFPCHNCTKHILAAGVKRVVYMEPYPKSRAKELHENEIELENETCDRVSFVPFIGISPYRYRDIFQKGKRKRSDGTAKRWYSDSGDAQPLLDIVLPSYFPYAEVAARTLFVGALQDQQASDQPSADGVNSDPPSNEA